MTTSPWIRTFVPAPQAPAQLICLPHAGGSASFFLPVARAMAPDVEVLAIQYPGRQDRHREPFADSIHDLADRIAEELRPLVRRPTAIFGHSMGAATGFEVASRLEADGAELLGLFVSGRRAPSTVRDDSVHLLADQDLIDELVRLEGTDPAMFADDELVRMFLPVVRQDYRAIETYRYAGSPALRCPVIVLTGTADPHVTDTEARAWRGHAAGDFDLREFAGGHFYLVEHSGRVLDVLRERISGALLPG
jgi:pyochelin biosynthetic protein PchC